MIFYVLQSDESAPKKQQEVIKPIQAPMKRPSADEPTVVLDMKISDSLNQALNRLKQMSIEETDAVVGKYFSQYIHNPRDIIIIILVVVSRLVVKGIQVAV